MAKVCNLLLKKRTFFSFAKETKKIQLINVDAVLEKYHQSYKREREKVLLPLVYFSGPEIYFAKFR